MHKTGSRGATPEAKQKFQQMAEMWTALAAELETIQPLIIAIDDLDFPVGEKPVAKGRRPKPTPLV